MRREGLALLNAKFHLLEPLWQVINHLLLHGSRRHMGGHVERVRRRRSLRSMVAIPVGELLFVTFAGVSWWRAVSSLPLLHGWGAFSSWTRNLDRMRLV